MTRDWPSEWRGGRPCHDVQSSPVFQQKCGNNGKSAKLPTLRIHAINHSREGDDLANVFGAANPGDGTLKAHPEAGVRNAAEAAQIEVPLEGFFGQVVLVQALQEQIVIVNALAAADDFAVALRSDHVES